MALLIDIQMMHIATEHYATNATDVSKLLKVCDKMTRYLQTESRGMEGEINRIPMNSVSWHSMSLDSICKIIKLNI